MYRNLVDNGFFIVPNFFSNYGIARFTLFILLLFFCITIKALV